MKATSKKTIILLINIFGLSALLCFFIISAGNKISIPQSDQPSHLVSVSMVPVQDVLMIKNKGDADWNGVKVCLNNPPYNSARYEYTIYHLAAGEEMTIDLSLFIKEDGERFNWRRYAVVKIWIGGGGYDWGSESLKD
jgi:hypothetical protein